MAGDAASLTLSYESFGKLWKALVSKRKARKLNVDRDQVWDQLQRGGGDAGFLGTLGASKSRAPDTEVDSAQRGDVAESAAETTKAVAASKRSAAAAKTAPASATTAGQSTRSGTATRRSGKKRAVKAAPRRKSAGTRN